VASAESRLHTPINFMVDYKKLKGERLMFNKILIAIMLIIVVSTSIIFAINVKESFTLKDSEKTIETVNKNLYINEVYFDVDENVFYFVVSFALHKEVTTLVVGYKDLPVSTIRAIVDNKYRFTASISYDNNIGKIVKFYPKMYHTFFRRKYPQIKIIKEEQKKKSRTYIA
jgi:hypothetical protein